VAFRLAETDEYESGAPAAAAMLSLGQIELETAPPDFRGRCGAVGEWLARRWHGLDLVHDLAEEIGSARWYRGFGTMLGLSAVALAFWPDFTEVEAAVAVPADAAVRDEYRAQMILPLVMGGDSGSRVGPTAAVVPIARVPERARIAMVATLGEGDSFGRMLQRAGVGADDAARAADMVSAALPLSAVTPGTRFRLMLGRRAAEGAPRPLEHLSFRARFDLGLSLDRHQGQLALTRQPITMDTTPLRITGTVGAGLYRSARASGAPVEAVQQYLQAIDSHVDLESGIAPGDRFDFVVDYKRSAEGESQVGRLLYAGLERGGKPQVQLLRWGSEGQLVDAATIGASRQQEGTRLFAPVNGRMTSGYGLRRHPILGYARMHAGIDFGAPWGSPIYAVSSGMVKFAGRHGGHGNYVRLDHGGGLATGYAHMSRIAVSPGVMVQAGQVIGYVGSTGLSTGPHLHYELYRNGQTVNPASVSFMMARPVAVDPGQIAAFKARLAQVKAIPAGKALKSLKVEQPGS